LASAESSRHERYMRRWLIPQKENCRSPANASGAQRPRLGLPLQHAQSARREPGRSSEAGVYLFYRERQTMSRTDLLIQKVNELVYMFRNGDPLQKAPNPIRVRDFHWRGIRHCNFSLSFGSTIAFRFAHPHPCVCVGGSCFLPHLLRAEPPLY
jgi:hypothetical protein